MTTEVLPIAQVPNSASAVAVAADPSTTHRASHVAALGDATQAPKPAPASPPPTPALQQTLAAVAKQIESYLRSVGRQLEFRVDDATGDTVITVRDAQTGEVVRQIPGDETLRLARALGNGPHALIDMLA